jgi:predicted metalloprotease with PDZ domain
MVLRVPWRALRLGVIFFPLAVSLFIVLPGAQAQTTGPARLRYSLQFADAGDADVVSRLRVSIALPAGESGPRKLIIPRVIPMGYGTQPYDQFVQDVAAFDSEGGALPVQRAEGPRWTVGSEGARLARVEYQVDIAQMEQAILSAGDSSRARPGYVFVLGYSAFTFIEGLEHLPVQLVAAPPANRPAWPVFSTLAGEESVSGTVSAEAENYYALADSQLVLGPQARRLAAPLADRDARYRGFSLKVILFSEADVDEARLLREVAETFPKVNGYFGRRPFDRYSAIFEFIKLPTWRHRAGFSMEHLASATFCLEAGASPRSEQDWARARYNIAHHLAHAWIPKRAYGRGYFPFQWEVAEPLDSIWFSEGFGQYAAIDALADAMPEKEGAAYRERAVEARFRILREMPRFLTRTPLVELSYMASTQYSEDFRIGRTVFSRGGLMAFEMDQRIRAGSKGTRRLRDALRHLLAWSEKNKRGFRIEELPAIFREATGVDTRDILEKWLQPMP